MTDPKKKQLTSLNLKASTWDFITKEIGAIGINECEYFSRMIEGIFKAQRKGNK